MKLLRPQQYAKNALVFVPLLTSHIFTTEALITATTAFVAFCCCASSVYIVNDIVDLELDRRHPSKRHRPLAAGLLVPLQAIWLALVLLIAGLALGAAVSWSLSAVLAGYSCLSFAYSFWLKRAICLGHSCPWDPLRPPPVRRRNRHRRAYLSPWLLAFSIFMLSGLAVLQTAYRIDTAPGLEPFSRIFEPWIRSEGHRSSPRPRVRCWIQRRNSICSLYNLRSSAPALLQTVASMVPLPNIDIWVWPNADPGEPRACRRRSNCVRLQGRISLLLALLMLLTVLAAI